MKDSVLEVCVDSLDAARAAEGGGSDRIELCADLSIGGVTPSLGLMTATIEALSIPVYVMIRPRGGGFTRSADEYDQMRKQIGEAKRIGAAGVVLGILHPDGRVDVERSRALVSLAYPMKVTFHRAFDEAPELSEALEAVIQTGAHCLLTSGGEPDVLAGSDAIARLVAQADGRLDVMAGGGVTLANLLKVVRRTGVSYLHGSLTGERKNGGNPKECAQNRQVALEANVREAVRLFRAELSMREARKKILR